MTWRSSGRPLRPQTVTAAGRSYRVAGERELTIPLAGATAPRAAGLADAVPGPQDARRLGIRVTSIAPVP